MCFSTNNLLSLKLLFIILLMSTHSTFSQQYEKTYRQNINYTTGNQNGKDVQLDFACKYDAFFGEPLFSSRTKVISEGNFVMYNGTKYYRSDIGDEIFDNIKIGLINVSFDIYQGNSKITTVSLHNEISVSFIPGSPEWDEMWPGVSEERVKQIWKDGYSIRNARLYDVEFSGFYALENFIRKKEEDEQKKIEEEKRQKEETEKKAKEEQERLEQEQKEKEEAEQKQKEADEEAEKERLQDELRKKEEEKERERKRKEEEERRKQEKINAYKERVENQRKENNAIAASAAASSAGILYLLGGIIYNKMGIPANDLYTGSNFHVNFDFGYGASLFPIANNSETTGINEFSGEEFTTENNDPVSAITIDLRLALKVGYEMEYAGANIFGRFEPGFSPVFTAFNTSYGYGAEAFVGHKNIKLYGRYESGSQNFSSSNWIDPEEIGEGGKSSTKYQQLRAGLKISYYRNARTAKRDHLIFGIIENYFNEDSATIFGIRENPDEPILDLLSTPSSEESNPYIANGYFFEWKRDHTHRLYIEIFPNYPVTGEIGGLSNEGKVFIQAGFSRSIEGFFGNK